MEVFNSIKSTDGTKDLISVRAYKGDAMTLLCFDVDESLSQGLAGFTIHFKNQVAENYLYNRMIFPAAFLANNPQIPKRDRNSTLYSPIQRFGWIHVPSVGDGSEPIWGDYTYQITPRFIKNEKLEDLDFNNTVSVKINVSPFKSKNTEIAFTRGFVSSVAYVKRFGLENNKVRPKGVDDKLLFDISKKSGVAKRWNNALNNFEMVDYSFAEQHKWLGWQVRKRILDFLDEAINDANINLKVFAYDLDEPEICRRLLTLAAQDRLKIILDDIPAHNGPTEYETAFDTEFRNVAPNQQSIYRGNFSSQAHSKVFIQIKNNEAVKVLTGSTNFATNGLYINANHILIFSNKKVAKLYEDVFDASFGDANMSSFKGSQFSTTDFDFNENDLPKFTVTFAPHPKIDATRIFDRISQKIKSAKSDVFFAVMKDTNDSSILRAIQEQVRSDKVYTYGITDKVARDETEYNVFVYKPNLKRGVRVKASGVERVLPPPFGEVPGVSGYTIHHKFVVVDFKGKDPVVYCGSSNLTFNPEQKNGDNLLEIHDEDIVTVFAIEAARLVDHFQWRNKEITQTRMDLDDLSDGSNIWYKKYYNPNDLRCLERQKFIAPRQIE